MHISIARWTARRVILIVIGWLVAVPLAVIAAAAVYMWWEMSAQMNSGAAGIGAVSVDVPGVLVLVWLGAPVLFVATWAVLRSRRRRSAQ